MRRGGSKARVREVDISVAEIAEEYLPATYGAYDITQTVTRTLVVLITKITIDFFLSILSIFSVNILFQSVLFVFRSPAR